MVSLKYYELVDSKGTTEMRFDHTEPIMYETIYHMMDLHMKAKKSKFLLLSIEEKKL